IISPSYICLFSHITRPPPRSTLFPYTTLFRSVESVVARKDARSGAARGYRAPIRAAVAGRVAPRSAAHCRRAGEVAGESHDRPRDRKSTRLNSSHVEISYAVFCLKKKNIQRRD